VNCEQGDLGAAVADHVVGQALVAALVALAGVVDQQIASVHHSDPASTEKGHIWLIINGSEGKGYVREKVVKSPRVHVRSKSFPLFLWQCNYRAINSLALL
jgi:hypothetical protein